MRILQGLRKRKRDNRGLTLVELMCAIAILGLISATVGGVMVVSAQSYQRGAGEIELQQEAQIAVNQIADLVIDTTAQVTASADGSSVTIDKGTSRYVISHNSATCELLYSEYIINGDGSLSVVVENQLMAQNVTVFKANVDDFSTYGVLRLRMELVKGDRSYAADFTITARNGQLSVSEVTAAATIVTETELVLEPNQKYELTATVMGAADGRVTWELQNNTDVNTYVLEDAEDGKIYLHVGQNETADTMMLMVRTVATNGVSPLSQFAIPVHVRRVNDVSVSGTLTGGVPYKAGATYRVTANVAGTNLSRFLGLACDMDYVNPNRLTWSYSLKDADGNVVSDIGSYITWAEDSTLSCTTIALLQDLGDMELTVTATALHPDGTNKTSRAYGHEEDSWTLSGIIKVVMEGEWRRGGNSKMLLQNVDESNLITEEDGSQWLANRGVVNMTWFRLTSLGWVELGTQGNQGTYGSSQNTDIGLLANFATGSPLTLFEYLEPGRYSYSSPYYTNMNLQAATTHEVMKLKVEIDFGGYQTGSGVFDIEDIAFEYRNSHPDDAEDTWSPETGSHVVYVTPEDSTDTYTSYFRLLHGWDETYAATHGYYAYNRFVGVIKDEPGYVDDKCYDLTFLNAEGVPFRRSRGEVAGTYYDPSVPNEWGGLGSDVPIVYQDIPQSWTRLDQMNDQISSGNDENCTLTVRITQDEKDRFCVEGGTVIKEIYEYNYSFGSNWWQWMDDDTKAKYEMVDGCDGILEFHFMPANVQITNHTGNAPAVRYCPRVGEAGLNAGGYYYINATSRYKVSGAQAEYQVNNGGGWATQYTLSWNGSKWCD